jgi:DNA-binding IclR family transcriptional regulator
VHRAATVLEFLASCSDPVSFGQMAAALGMPRSSLHNICMALVDTGLIERGVDGRFQIGLRVVELARARLAKTELVGTFLETCREVGGIGETLVLGVLSGVDVVYVAVINADRPLAVRYQIGMRLPAWSTGTGKAILSTLGDANVKQLITSANTESGARAAGPDLENLLAELQATRQRGYSVDDEETSKGMVCIGVPIFEDNEEQARSAIAFSMVKASAKPFSTELTSKLTVLADTISRRLGSGPRLPQGASGTPVHEDLLAGDPPGIRADQIQGGQGHIERSAVHLEKAGQPPVL